MTLDKIQKKELEKLKIEANIQQKEMTEQYKNFMQRMDKEVDKRDKKEIKRNTIPKKSPKKWKAIHVGRPKPIKTSLKESDETTLFNILKDASFTIKDKKAAAAILSYYAKRIARKYIIGSTLIQIGFGALVANSLIICFQYTDRRMLVQFVSVIIFHLGLYIRDM